MYCTVKWACRVRSRQQPDGGTARINSQYHINLSRLSTLDFRLLVLVKPSNH